jgi:hypothetical protein
MSLVKYKNTWTPNQSTRWDWFYQTDFLSLNSWDLYVITCMYIYIYIYIIQILFILNFHDHWYLMCNGSRIQFTLFSSENEIKNVYICLWWNIKIHEPQINQPAFLCPLWFMKCGHYFAGILVNKHGMSWLLNPAFANIDVQ